MADEQKEAMESSLQEEWSPMSTDLVIVGLIEETMLDIDTCIKVKKTTSLQSIHRIDVVHSIRFRLVLTDAEPLHALLSESRLETCRSPG